MELRSYQKEAVKKVEWSLTMEGNSILSLPTGSGKSHVIAEVALNNGKDVLILQPSREILEQNRDKLQAIVGKDVVGVYSASLGSKVIKKYTFATIGSIYKKPEDFVHFNLIIIDECHLLNPKRPSGMFLKFINKVNFLKGSPIKIIGLTATAYRLTQQYVRYKNGFVDTITTIKLINRVRCKDGSTFWNRLIFNINVGDLIAQGFLCPLKYHNITLIRQEDMKLNISHSDFDLTAFEKQIEAKEVEIHKVIEACSSNCKSTLVFCATVDQAEKFAEKYDCAEVVTAKSKPKERKRIIEGFKNGEIKMVFNVGVLTCITDDMELLTRNKGWVGIDEISDTDLVAQYNNGKISFSKPIKIVKKEIEIDKEMIQLNGRYQSFTVTPTHNMLISKRKNLSLIKLPAKDCVDKRWFIPVSGETLPEKIIIKNKNLPKKWRFISQNSFNYRKKGLSKIDSISLAEKEWSIKSNLKYKNPDELSLDECLFIGFWLGDGCVSGRDKRYQITQSMRTPKMVEWIDKLLNNLQYQYSRKEYPSNSNSKIVGNNCNTFGYVTWSIAKGTGGNTQHCKGLYSIIPYLNKDGIDYFWGLNKKQYISLMEGLWMADGWHGNCKKYDGSKIIGATKNLFDLLQSIGVCRGFRVTIKEVKKREFNKKQLYNLSITEKKFHQMSNDRMKIIKNIKNKRVWCATMPEGTIVTRDKGTVTVMGNTGFDSPRLDCIILLRPTRSIGLYMQMVGRGLRKCEGKEYCRIVDMTDTVKQIGRVETIKMERIDNKWELTSERGLWHNRELYKFSIQK